MLICLVVCFKAKICSLDQYTNNIQCSCGMNDIDKLLVLYYFS